MAVEKITELPEPLTEMECLLYYIATGEVPACLPSRPTNKVQTYLRYIAENGIAVSAAASVETTSFVPEDTNTAADDANTDTAGQADAGE